jgi:G3E family GTPase
MKSLPVLVLSGFLGSGKTHLLNKHIQSAELSNAAFIINEFGALGLDHHLIEAIHGDVILLRNGCICCSVRDDLAATMRDLWDRRCEGTVSAFDRVVIETTGLADPTPLLATVLHDAVLKHHFHPATLVTTVDPLTIDTDVATCAEFIQQVLIADLLVITKADLATREQVAQTRQKLASLNPTAQITDSHTLSPPSLAQDFGSLRHGDIERWLNPAPIAAMRLHDDVNSFTLELGETIDWTVFGVWLSLLLHVHGESMLRVKGIVRVSDDAPPVVINGVRHSLYKPYHLESAMAEAASTRLVFIGRNLSEESIRASFEQFCTIQL